MNTDRFLSILLEILILGVVVALLLKPTDITTYSKMPQTITYDLESSLGEITTPRNDGEPMQEWLEPR
jgi:hypothetical protein